MICSFDAFDLLFTGRNLSLKDTVGILITVPESVICSPDAAGD
jgi:hypothetical protein